MRTFELTHQQNIEELREQLERAPRRPVGYDPEKLKRLMLQKTTTATVKNDRSRVYIGERGGRYTSAAAWNHHPNYLLTHDLG